MANGIVSQITQPLQQVEKQAGQTVQSVTGITPPPAPSSVASDIEKNIMAGTPFNVPNNLPQPPQLPQFLGTGSGGQTKQTPKPSSQPVKEIVRKEDEGIDF